MTRLIYADELFGELCDHLEEDEDTERAWVDIEAIVQAFNHAPTVHAVPVRHGKWLDPETFKRPWFRHHIFECSVCRNTLDMDGVNAGRGDANYCPNCGAKMDVDGEEE